MRVSYGLFFSLTLVLLTGLAACDSGSPGDIDQLENLPPVASAGIDQEITLGEAAILNGRGSADPDGDLLSYAWTFLTRPNDSMADITAPTADSTGFIPDVAGIYIVSLTVSDGLGGTATDDLMITAGMPSLTGTITQATTLSQDTYSVPGNLVVNNVLTLEPGVTLVFGPNAGLQVNPNGALVAIGTAADSIRFTGSVAVPGFWQGIAVRSNNPRNEMAYVRIAHGGGSPFGAIGTATDNGAANLVLDNNARLMLYNSRLTNSGNYGLHTDPQARLAPFNDNTFTGNAAAPIHSLPAQLRDLNASNTFSGNGNDFIDVYTAGGTTATLSQDQSWPALDVPYRITSVPSINATLTLEAGTDFVFTADAGLNVGANGALVAIGTAADSIRFTGSVAVPGFWQGIAVRSNNPRNEMAYVRIAHGGGSPFSGIGTATDNGAANLVLDDGALLNLHNNTLTESRGWGLWLEGEAQTDPQDPLSEEASNTFANNARGDARVPGMDIIPPAPTLTGPVDAPLTLSPGEYAVSTSVSVNNVLTLEPGVTLVFGPNAGLQVNPNGALVAIGTAADSIRFTGSVAVPGFWQGIAVRSNNPRNEMAYVRIAHGGGSPFGAIGTATDNGAANLVLDNNARLMLYNSRLTNSGNYGLHTDPQARLAPFNDNTFTGNAAAPIHLLPAQLRDLNASNTFSGNGNDFIDVYTAGGTTATLSQDQSWPALDVPYRITSVPSINATLTLEAGTDFVFTADAGLNVGANGALVAIGTAADSIRFTGSVAVPGFWQGIAVRSNNPRNEMAYVRIAHGGGSPFGAIGTATDNGAANLVLDNNARLMLYNSRLTNSGNYGLHTDPQARLAPFNDNTFTGNAAAPIHLLPAQLRDLNASNTFSGNGNDFIDVYTAGGTTATLSQDQSWPALDVPYRITSVPSIDATLTLEAGTDFVFTADAGLNVGANGALVAIGTAADSIRFTGSVAVPGFWQGIAVRSNNPRNEMAYVRIAHGGGSPFGAIGTATDNGAANLVLDNNARLMLYNSRLTNSGNYGLHTDPQARLAPFNDNTFTSNAAAPIHLLPTQLGLLNTTHRLVGNADDVVAVYTTDESSGIITADQTWPALEVPYRFHGQPSLQAAVTIDPGATLTFAANIGLEVAANGALIAIGTPADSVRFVGAVAVPGFWQGLVIRSSRPENALTYAVVAHGGSGGFGGIGTLTDPGRANVVLDNETALVLQNSRIASSSGWGLWLDPGVLLTPADPLDLLSGNVFESNTLGPIGQ